MVLSNGASSPVFTAKNHKDSGLDSFAIQNFVDVKRINGKILDNGSGLPLSRICFSKMDGSEITKVEFSTANPYGQETVLAADEEIIGIHGNKTHTNSGITLGFIVWKPPKY